VQKMGGGLICLEFWADYHVLGLTHDQKVSWTGRRMGRRQANANGKCFGKRPWQMAGVFIWK